MADQREEKKRREKFALLSPCVLTKFVVSFFLIIIVTIATATITAYCIIVIILLLIS